MSKINKNVIKDCIKKLDKVSDDTWEDIIRRYDLDLNPHELRKRSYGMKAYEEVFEERDNDELIEIKKEKMQLQDLRTDVNRKIRQYARIESLIDEIKQECSEDYTFLDTDHVELFENGSEAILMISDMHYDGRQIIIDKFNKTIDYTINKCQFHKINKLIVFLGGDLINNEFRTTTRIENRENVAEQLVNTARLVSEGIYKLSKNIPYVLVANVAGNHERSIDKYQEALSTDNYLCIMQELIELRLKNLHNVVFLSNLEGDNRFCVLDFQGKTYVLTHGDALKTTSKNAVTTVEGYLGIKIDYLLVGHFHKVEQMYYASRIIVNGAINNNFDYSKKGLLNTPEYQRLLLLDNEGDVECIYDIKL